MTTVDEAVYTENLVRIPAPGAFGLAVCHQPQRSYPAPSRPRGNNCRAEAFSTQKEPVCRYLLEGPLTRVEKVDGFPRQVWCDADGRVVIEEYIIGRMGHGTPISAGGDKGLGEEGKYMLEVGISSTRHIADFWGLTQ